MGQREDMPHQRPDGPLPVTRHFREKAMVMPLDTKAPEPTGNKAEFWIWDDANGRRCFKGDGRPFTNPPPGKQWTEVPCAPAPSDEDHPCMAGSHLAHGAFHRCDPDKPSGSDERGSLTPIK